MFYQTKDKSLSCHLDIVFIYAYCYPLKINIITMSCSKKASDYGLSDLEYKIICHQIERRKKYRKEFLDARTDPCRQETGYVFDPAIQKFLSMKETQLQHFAVNFRTIRFGIFAILLPMFSYGYLVWNHRTNREWDIRCGKLRYRDRMAKLQ